MNNSPAIPFGLPDTAPELARRFAVIMAGLAALVARRFVRMPRLIGLTLLLWSRLNRAVRRFHRALTEPAYPPPARPRAVRGGRARTRAVALPSGRGWLVRELGWEAAGFMAQLEALLAEVESRAALARAPAAGRILRPICRMLAVDKSVTPVLERPAFVPVARPCQAPASLPVEAAEGEGRGACG